MEGHGLWEELAAYRQVVTWQVASGTETRGQVHARILGKAGFGAVADGSVSAEWSGYSPGFSVASGESGDVGLARVVAVVSDLVRHGRVDYGEVVGATAADGADWAVGDSGEHPLSGAEVVDEGAGPATWVRLVGPDRFADAHDFAGLYQVGSRWRKRGVTGLLRAGDLAELERAIEGGERRRWILRDLEANTDGRAAAWAAAALRQVAVLEELGRVEMPAHAGIELWDVVEVTAPVAGWSGELMRVQEVGLEYERGVGESVGPRGRGGARARYDSVLVLGAR